VLAAGHGDNTRARESLERLCRTYWYPLYAYVRRRGYSPEDAQDFTQECFARLLSNHSLDHANPNRGKFRSFLLGALNHCLADEWTRRRAQKRGGGILPISLDVAEAELHFQAEGPDDTAPDQAFDRHWATALLNQVLDRLDQEYRANGKAVLFEALKQTLVGGRDAPPYAALAAQLGLSEAALRIAMHRLRKRYRELIREEIAHTVTSPADVEGEIRYLFRMFAEGR
jgi:RNA polymerase sigma-70 factor (ECF subfamily)